MRLQTGESRIAPVGQIYNLAGWRSFHFRRIGRLHNLETAAIEKEGMIPEQIVQLGDRRMIVGKNLSVELGQGLLHLCRIYLHGLLLLTSSCPSVLLCCRRAIPP